MSKNIVIIILIALLVGSLYFGFQQKTNADQLVSACAKEKEELVNAAIEQQKRASQFQDMAEMAQHEAMVQRTICEEQLKELKK